MKDSEFTKLYDWAIQRSQGGRHDNSAKRERFYFMYQLADNAIRKWPHHSIAEFGCWWGHSTLMTQVLMSRHGSTGRLHVFDSFKGLSPFGPQDETPMFPTDEAKHSQRQVFKASRDHLFDITDKKRVVIYKGWIPESFEGIDIGHAIAFSNIDVDLYQPTLASLEYVYPRVVSGGAIYLDDYGAEAFPGAATAVDDFLTTVSPSAFIKLSEGAAFIIK